MQKFLALAGGAAMLAVVAIPALAKGGEDKDRGGEVEIRNYARVSNRALTISNSGLNKIGSGDEVEGGRIKTGNARAEVVALNDANYSQINTCDKCSNDEVEIKNRAYARNGAIAVANSGLNQIGARDEVEGGRIRTGRAVSYSELTNSVNTTIIGETD